MSSLEKAKANGLTAGYRNFFGIPVAGEVDFPEEIQYGTWINVPAVYISAGCSDIGKYLQMYLNNGAGIVKEESMETMLYDNVPGNGSYRYGMGWMYSEELYSKPVLWHAGLVENYSTYMCLLPEKEIAVAVLVNMNDYLVSDSFIRNIINPLIGEPRNGQPDMYLILHGIIDFICILLCAFSVCCMLRAFRRKNKEKRKKSVVPDVVVYERFVYSDICKCNDTYCIRLIPVITSIVIIWQAEYLYSVGCAGTIFMVY